MKLCPIVVGSAFYNLKNTIPIFLWANLLLSITKSEFSLCNLNGVFFIIIISCGLEVINVFFWFSQKKKSKQISAIDDTLSKNSVQAQVSLPENGNCANLLNRRYSHSLPSLPPSQEFSKFHRSICFIHLKKTLKFKIDNYLFNFRCHCGRRWA